jgi:macrolide transport system ATP-binding/permease protein
MSDIRYAVRWLVKSPSFALVALLSLGFGIGFNTAIYAIVDALLLRPLPVTEPERLVDLYTSGSDFDAFASSSLPDLVDYRAGSDVFEEVVAYSPMFGAVAQGDRARLTLGEVVSGNYFSVFGVKMRMGRGLAPEDDRAGAPRVAVISEQYWNRELARDPKALERTLRIRGESYAIIGIADGGFTGMVPLLAPELWIPLAYVDDVEPAGIQDTVPSPTGTTRLDRRGQRWLFAKARLKPGVSVETAGVNMELVAARLRMAHPATNKDRRVTVRAAADTRVHPAGDGMLRWVVSGTMGAVGLLLVIACANVAGMLLARSAARQREIGIRLAIGASRWRIVRQLLAESLVLGAGGLVIGVALALWLTRVLATIDLPIPIPIVLDLRLDWRVLTFAAIAAGVTALAAGLAPAARAARLDLVSDLKGGTPGGRVGGRRWTLRDGLVVAQIAVTVLLLVSAGLMLRSLSASQRADVGFQTSGLAMVSVETGMLGYDEARSNQFFDGVLARLRERPDVDAVALASRVPFSLNYNSTNIAVPGHQTAPDQMGPSISSGRVSPEYFAALGIGLLHGRVFAESDTPETPRVAIVNDTFARKYWPGEPAIGREVFERALGDGRNFQIVGVVADHKLQTVGETPRPVIYFSTTQRRDLSFNVIVARTKGDETALLRAMRQTVLALEPLAIFIDDQTMKDQISATLFPIRAAAVLVGIFGVAGLALAAIGLYGVIAFSVARRSREIGIRMALGAQPASVLRMIMRQGLALAAVGLAVGLLLALAATTVLKGALYGAGAADPIAWAGAAILLLAVAAVANLIPARRAMLVDPVRVMRTE